MIKGYATGEGTGRTAAAHPELTYGTLGRTDWLVAQAGFGCYRTDVREAQHEQALREALRRGVNLIDTSANYMDGRAEELVGEVLRGGAAPREGVVIVSKAGYLQGRNYLLSQERKREGRPFPDLVEFGQGLEHCIHPEFLEDQLTRSLARLQMERIDLYLLHNPEYFLNRAERDGVPVEKARAEYERRIELAFRHLEREVSRGRIGCYGISSNTFPAGADAYSFTSLERVLQIAEQVSAAHHFRAIQLPMNLLERGGATERNQSGGRTVLELARETGLGVLINRPLNAFHENTLVRLADLPVRAVAGRERIEDDLRALERLEAELRETWLPLTPFESEVREQLADQLSMGRLLLAHGFKFRNLAHCQEVLGQFVEPTVNSAIDALWEADEEVPQLGSWAERYVDGVNRALGSLTSHYMEQAQRANQELKARAAAADDEWGAARRLSRTALRALRSTAGITTVLVGMRRTEYVEDVIEELTARIDVRDRTASWEKLCGI